MQTTTLNDARVLNVEPHGQKQTYVIDFSRDEDASVWIAISDEIPIALESESLDTLIGRVKLAVPELLELNYGITEPPELFYREVSLQSGRF